MKIPAALNYLRMSPRKVRLVAQAIRGKRVPDAERALKFLSRRAASPLEKLLSSAVASARHNFQVTDPDTLVVSEILVNAGPTLKRRRARAMGRAFPIRKRTSHVRLVLETTALLAKPARRPAAPTVSAGGKIETLRDQPSRLRAGRSIFRARPPKAISRPAEFVRRIFRRKAI
ncbi:MAG: 50S ribosomal protein L22 [Candidatus Sungbacteria bacterium]|uniref:Large ribosomal subunit protein uL22 n=1 Tax=Candidatus Sungiibacteriota bacterium TaxID=2750080 RepID=A0A932YWV2_9BACT|nr:50S ribosomal protein L22 [Candidatus Sungbacteria bacterium]